MRCNLNHVVPARIYVLLVPAVHLDGWEWQLLLLHVHLDQERVLMSRHQIKLLLK